MKKTKTQLHNELREKYIALVTDYFKSLDEDVQKTASNEIAFPVLDSEGNEENIIVIVKVPKGSRDGTPYNPYEYAEEYQLKLRNKAIKKAKAEEKKKKKGK